VPQAEGKAGHGADINRQPVVLGQKGLLSEHPSKRHIRSHVSNLYHGVYGDKGSYRYSELEDK
jgi:hypothetical protein